MTKSLIYLYMLNFVFPKRNSLDMILKLVFNSATTRVRGTLKINNISKR